MSELKRRIQAEGRVLPGNIVKIDGFLNHLVDTKLLGEIADELQVSRQAVYDNLTRAEALLLHMEEKTGCVSRDLRCRRAASMIRSAAEEIVSAGDPSSRKLGQGILDAVRSLEE